MITDEEVFEKVKYFAEIIIIERGKTEILLKPLFNSFKLQKVTLTETVFRSMKVYAIISYTPVTINIVPTTRKINERGIYPIRIYEPNKKTHPTLSEYLKRCYNLSNYEIYELINKSIFGVL